MTFFLVINQVFLILTLSFQILCVIIVSNVIYDPFFTTKSPLSTKKIPWRHLFFTLFKLSRPSHNTTSQNIGGPTHGPSPTSNFGGSVPPGPLGLRPWATHANRGNYSIELFCQYMSLALHLFYFTQRLLGISTYIQCTQCSK